MKVAILEDEPLAAEKLSRYLQKCDPMIEVVQVLESLEKAIPWMREHNSRIDLYFMDVQLTDGLSFDIFSAIKIDKPVIFTTAFDEFAIDAFKVNSIDYLLKPITFTDLSTALKKLKSLQRQFSSGEQLAPVVKELARKTYKDRFLIRIGNHIKAVSSQDVLVFYAEGRDVSLMNTDGKSYPIDFTIEALLPLLDPQHFFRVNRSCIVALDAIADVVMYSSRRLRLYLKRPFEKEIVVSREKVVDFKKWWGGN